MSLFVTQGGEEREFSGITGKFNLFIVITAHRDARIRMFLPLLYVVRILALNLLIGWHMDRLGRRKGEGDTAD
jgi:hypothetical protein